MRGLKYNAWTSTYGNANVAPFMGAWIEINKMESYVDYATVAPFMGAWIEIIGIYL